jgi:hypothetical protein
MNEERSFSGRDNVIKILVMNKPKDCRKRSSLGKNCKPLKSMANL